MNAPELPATFDQAAPHLALRTYGAANLGIRRTMLDAAGASSGAPAVAPVAGELSVGVDFELEDGRVVPLSEANLAAWGVGVDAAITAARARLAGTDVEGLRALAEGTYLIQNEQFLAAALVHPAMVAGFPVSGEATLLAASAVGGLLTGSEDRTGLAAAYELADQMFEADVLIETTTPLQLRDGEWQAADVPTAHPDLGDAAALVSRKVRAQAYQQQADVLSDDAHIAKAKLFAKPEGGAVLVATWTAGVETLLPEVDDVLVVRGENDVTPYPFATFLAHAGAAATPTDTVPARYRISATAAL